MSQQFCMTLRLDPAIEELVAEAAHDKGVTKTDWIRTAIRQKLKAERNATLRYAVRPNIPGSTPPPTPLASCQP